MMIPKNRDISGISYPAPASRMPSACLIFAISDRLTESSRFCVGAGVSGGRPPGFILMARCKAA
jgi:hypothetical protein